jgi:hypothetical protein
MLRAPIVTGQFKARPSTSAGSNGQQRSCRRDDDGRRRSRDGATAGRELSSSDTRAPQPERRSICKRHVTTAFVPTNSSRNRSFACPGSGDESDIMRSSFWPLGSPRFSPRVLAAWLVGSYAAIGASNVQAADASHPAVARAACGHGGSQGKRAIGRSVLPSFSVPWTSVGDFVPVAVGGCALPGPRWRSASWRGGREPIRRLPHPPFS